MQIFNGDIDVLWSSGGFVFEDLQGERSKNECSEALTST